MSEVSGRSGAATSDAPSKPLKTDVMAPNVWPQPVPTLRSTDVRPEKKKTCAHVRKRHVVSATADDTARLGMNFQ